MSLQGVVVLSLQEELCLSDDCILGGVVSGPACTAAGELKTTGSTSRNSTTGLLNTLITVEMGPDLDPQEREAQLCVC